MNFINSLSELFSKIKNSFKRFPITISWAIAGTLFTLYTTQAETFDALFHGKIILIFILGISWLIATRFFEEQFKKRKTWLFIIPIAFLLLFYFSIYNDDKDMSSVSITRYILYFLAGHLLIFVAPFLLKWNTSAFFNYLKAVFTAIAKSFLFSLILYLGIVLALLAVMFLFNVDFDDKRFLQMFIICLGIVNTAIYVSDFPKEIHSETTVNYTKSLEVLVKYILIPLVILYLIILYAYSLKIILNWNLPKGWVSYLVIALALLGFIIQILVNPIQKNANSRPIKKFYPWFYYLLLPLVALLFIAIFRRINEYGITEKRYFVVVIALWILAMIVYMLFSKNKKTSAFLLSLAVLSFFISFGFWGAFSIATKSQVHQFKKVFTNIKSTNFSTTSQKKEQLRSIVRYLSTKEALHEVADVLGYNPKNVFKTDNNWKLQNLLMDSLAIKVTDENTNRNTNKHYSINEEKLVINVKNYDILQRVYLYSNSRKDSFYNLTIQSKSNLIILQKKNIIIDTIDCSNLIKKLKEQYKTYDVDQKNMSLIRTFKNLNIKLIFTNISLNNYKNDKEYLSSANAYLLIKEKNAE